MAYIGNPFKVGQYAICVNDNFPDIITTGDKSQIGMHPAAFPRKNEICHVDEIRGEFLRFDEYDCNDENHPEFGCRWWIHTHFKQISNEEVEEYYEYLSKSILDRALGKRVLTVGSKVI
jgi:hypothetical protein